MRFKTSNVSVGPATYIRDLCYYGALDDAFKVVDAVETNGLPISRDIIYSLLQGCKRQAGLDSVRRVRALMVKHGLSTIPALGDHLIRLFSSHESLQEAKDVFYNIIRPTTFTWNSLISAHLKVGEGNGALVLYERMQEENITPDRVTFVSMCNACGSIGAIVQGMLIHHQAIQNAFESNVILGNAIIDMYANCGCLTEARKMFETGVKDVLTWTVIISGYCMHGDGLGALELYTRMRQNGINPNKAAILWALKSSANTGLICQGQLIFEEVLEEELESDLAIMSCVIYMYVKCGSLTDARKVFSGIPSHDVISWSVMIDGYAQSGKGLFALELYANMLHSNVRPNEVVYLGVLKACASLEEINFGFLIHMEVIENAHEANVLIGSALVDLFGKCKCLEEAYSVFIKLRNRNIVSWGAMISGFCQCGQERSAFQFFYKMIVENIEPSEAIFLCMIKSCGAFQAIDKGMLIHCLILQNGLESDLTIGNTLVDMYAKCGDLEAARKVFDKLSIPDVVSFGALISGYSYQEQEVLALDLFDTMQEKGIKPERATFLSILRACSSMGAVRSGKLIHDQIIRHGLDSAPLIINALIDMYAKAGRLYEAYKLYFLMSNQDVVSCSAIIEGCMQLGDCKIARELVNSMCEAGLKPDTAIFLSILTGCSNAGLLEEGHALFLSMQEDFGMIPTKEHYGCLIDLLARAGQLYRAKDLLQTMPVRPDIITWTSILGGCRTHSNRLLGNQCFTQLLHWIPHSSSCTPSVNLNDCFQDWERIDCLQREYEVTNLKNG